MDETGDLKTYKFDFTVKNISLGEARAVNQVILASVEGFDGQMGGGFAEVKAEKTIDEELRDLVSTGDFDEFGVLQPKEDPDAAELFVEALQDKIESIHKAGPSATISTQAWDAGYIHGLQFAINLIKGEVDDAT